MRTTLWSVGLGLALNASSAFCANYFANCNQFTKDIADVTKVLSDKERLDKMSALANDLVAIELNSHQIPADIPANLIRSCQMRKNDAFKQHRDRISAAAQDSLAYKKIMAQYFKHVMHDPGQAYIFTSGIIELEPLNWTARQDAFELWANQEIARIKALPPNTVIGSKELQNILKKSHELLDPLIENPKASREIKSKTLTLRAMLKEKIVIDNSDPSAPNSGVNVTGGRFADANNDWEKAAEYDPNNSIAWKKIATFRLSRNRKNPELAVPALQKYLSLESKEKNIWLTLVQIFLFQSKQEAQALIEIRKALSHFPGDSDFLALELYGLIATGRQDEAQNKMNQYKAQKEAPALKSPYYNLAMALRSKIDGIKATEAGRDSQAIGFFQESLKLNEKDHEVRNSLAQLVFNFADKRSDKTSPAIKKDMDEVIKILEPSKEDRSEKRFRILIRAARLSSKPERANTLCGEYEQEFNSLTSADIILDCAEIYSSNKDKSAAKRILQNASNNKQLGKDKPKILQRLSEFQ